MKELEETPKDLIGELVDWLFLAVLIFHMGIIAGALIVGKP